MAMVALRKEKVLCHVLFALFFFNFLFLGGHIFTLIVGTPSPLPPPVLKAGGGGGVGPSKN